LLRAQYKDVFNTSMRLEGSPNDASRPINHRRNPVLGAQLFRQTMRSTKIEKRRPIPAVVKDFYLSQVPDDRESRLRFCCSWISRFRGNDTAARVIASPPSSSCRLYCP
jgi:hypothetical protein